VQKLIRLAIRPQRLAFVTSFFILAATVSLTLLWPTAGQGLNSRAQTSLLPGLGGYQSPERCRECHDPEFQEWTHTSHAQASFDPIFQLYLQQVEKPGECFACHATGYNTTTGQFILAGVTCEACHGPYRPEHPQESMTIATSADFCGSCHPNTLFEWRSSQHGLAGISCIDCHEVHTQKTRAFTTMNSLCTTCHQDQIQNALHANHLQSNVHCIDCHLVRSGRKEQEAINGQAATGHTFAVFVKTCRDCHSSDVEIP